MNFETKQQEYETLEKMEKFGGSFVQLLAKLYRIGDGFNQTKLRETFKNFFIEYRDGFND